MQLFHSITVVINLSLCLINQLAYTSMGNGINRVGYHPWCLASPGGLGAYLPRVERTAADTARGMHGGQKRAVNSLRNRALRGAPVSLAGSLPLPSASVIKIWNFHALPENLAVSLPTTVLMAGRGLSRGLLPRLQGQWTGASASCLCFCIVRALSPCSTHTEPTRGNKFFTKWYKAQTCPFPIPR